jgi:nitrogen fixation protein FixH
VVPGRDRASQVFNPQITDRGAFTGIGTPGDYDVTEKKTQQQHNGSTQGHHRAASSSTNWRASRPAPKQELSTVYLKLKPAGSFTVFSSFKRVPVPEKNE